jgi:hypothetical protein
MSAIESLNLRLSDLLAILGTEVTSLERSAHRSTATDMFNCEFRQRRAVDNLLLSQCDESREGHIGSSYDGLHEFLSRLRAERTRSGEGPPANPGFHLHELIWA